jgi:hypothetical protein
MKYKYFFSYKSTRNVLCMGEYHEALESAQKAMREMIELDKKHGLNSGEWEISDMRAYYKDGDFAKSYRILIMERN